MAKGKGKGKASSLSALEEAKLFDGGNAKMENKKKEEEVVEMEMELELEPEEIVKPEEMELELEMDGEELSNEMEDIVKEKVKEEEKRHQEQKSKRGPKPGSKNKASDDDDKEKSAPKKKELDLSNPNIIQREIKKGRLTAPQGRIERNDDGYEIFISDGVIFAKDQNWKSQGPVDIMHEGKFITTLKFQDLVNENGKFNAIHENGTKVEHDLVRVELHKPGRSKDVVELYGLTEASQRLEQRQRVLATKKKKNENKEEEKEEA